MKKLQKLLEELETYSIIRQIGCTPTDKSIYGTTFFDSTHYYPQWSYN